MNERAAAAAHRAAVCRVAADVFAGRIGATIATYWSPDELERQEKAVDLKCVDAAGAPVLVLEHTSVDSFHRQRDVSRWCIELLEPLETELDRTFAGPGHLVLGVNPAESKGLRKAGPKIRTELSEWIRGTGPTLEIGRPLVDGRHCAMLDVLGLGLNVLLCRWPHQDGRFFLRFNVPEDFERQRRERLIAALGDKCPKLAQAKRASDGAASILVLETQDLALGNEIDIAGIVCDELAKRTDVPDHVYVVETAHEPWSWLIAKEDAAKFPDIRAPGPQFLESQGSHDRVTDQTVSLPNANDQS